jgi:hypothetical protein
MKIDKDKFEEFHWIQQVPNWPCPHCNIGTLTFNKDDIKIVATTETIRNKSHAAHEPDWDRGVFRLLMKCSVKSCEEIVAVCGDAKVHFIAYEGGEDGYNETYDWHIQPRYFSQPINLFPLEHYYPKSIFTTLTSAFGLLWYDSASCANKIRSVVELIMDDFKEGSKKRVRNAKTGKIKLMSRTLHQRIIEFSNPTKPMTPANKQKQVDAGDYLLAIKWIGNVGSHSTDEKLKRKNLLVAFELLLKSLDILYNPEHRELKKIAKKIIKHKGKYKAKRKK